MKSKYITILTALAAVPLSYAQTSSYFLETDVGYTTRDTDLDDLKLNEDNIDFGAVFYFGKIESASYGDALRELPFTQRASSVDMQLKIHDLDDDIDNIIDLDAYAINGLWVGPQSGWYAKLGYVNTNTDSSGDYTSGIFRYQPEFDGYTAEIGKYVAQNTTIGLAYSEIDYENRRDNSYIESGSDTIGITFRHYTSLTDNTGFSLEGNLYFIDLQVPQFDDLDDDGLESSGEVYGLKATYYPSREFGIGISYSDADDLGGRPYLTSRTAIRDGVGLFAEWFVTERFSVNARYENSEYDLSNADDLDDPGGVESDSLTLGAAYRF